MWGLWFVCGHSQLPRFLRCSWRSENLPPSHVEPSPARPGGPAGRHEVRAALPTPPPCLCLCLPVGSAGLWREGGRLFAFRPWVTGTSRLFL